MSFVLDSSAMLAWIYSDETTEPIRRVFQAVADELAQRRTLPLATLDSELGTAAKALGLRVVGTD